MTPLGYSYRYARLSGLEMPPAAEWLSPGERCEYARLRDAGRRAGWLAGRWLVKRLLAERTGCSLKTHELAWMEICSRDASGKRIRPLARWSVGGLTPPARLSDWELAISHTRQSALVAVAPPGPGLGVDLVDPREAPSLSFDRVWFTREERQWIVHQPQQCRLALWAAKEAGYKALNRGEPFRPHELTIVPRADGGFDCTWDRPYCDSTCRLIVWQTPLAEIAVLAAPGTPQRAFPTGQSSAGASPSRLPH